MECQKIYACPNDCIMYKHEYEEMHKCPMCGISLYKVKDDDECGGDESTKKGPPAKMLWYLPIIPRFKRLFSNADDAKDLIWHANQRNCDGMLRQAKIHDVVYDDIEPKTTRKWHRCLSQSLD